MRDEYYNSAGHSSETLYESTSAAQAPPYRSKTTGRCSSIAVQSDRLSISDQALTYISSTLKGPTWVVEIPVSAAAHQAIDHRSHRRKSAVRLAGSLSPIQDSVLAWQCSLFPEYDILFEVPVRKSYRDRRTERVRAGRNLGLRHFSPLPNFDGGVPCGVVNTRDIVRENSQTY